MSCRLPVPSPRVIARFLCGHVSEASLVVECLCGLPNEVHAPDTDNTHSDSAFDVLKPAQC